MNTTNTTAVEIEEWCRTYVADLLGVGVDQVDPEVDFDRLGVDSALAVSLLVEVEDRYGVDLEPEVLFESPTIRAVSAHLQQRIEAGS